jgi:hypothetical protein
MQNFQERQAPHFFPSAALSASGNEGISQNDKKVSDTPKSFSAVKLRNIRI